MSKIIREVGFLALGIASILETAVYLRWWAWGDALAAPLLIALFLLLQGAYYAIDGAAWSDLSELVKGDLDATRTHRHLQSRNGPTWGIDFSALLVGALALGLTAQALASFEGHGGSHAAASPANQAWLLSAIGACLTCNFGLTAWYWQRLSRILQDPAHAAFVAKACLVWNGFAQARSFRWAFLAITGLAAGLATACLLLGANVGVLAAVDGAMAVLVAIYGGWTWRRPRLHEGAGSTAIGVAG